MRLALTNGGEVAVPVPAPGTCPSFFLVGLHKAGSTLFNNIMRPLGERAGAAYFSLPNELHALGVATGALAPDVNALFVPRGYAYGGFRGIEDPLALPPFASGRTVVLVRDPRDILTSLFFSEAFSHQPPGTAAGSELARMFEERRRAARAADIDDLFVGGGDRKQFSYRQMLRKVDPVGHRLFRYEDVVFDKRRWIAAVLDYLHIAADPKRVAAAVDRHDVRPEREDVRRHIRRVTPGDHREKLGRAAIRALDEKFADILARFGYA